MDNDIFKIAFKHHIYDLCINLCFDNILKNFPKNKPVVPKVGEVFSTITDTVNGDVYQKCTIIKDKDLDIYDDMTPEEKKSVLISIKYVVNMYDDEVIEENGSQYFIEEEFASLLFRK